MLQIHIFRWVKSITSYEINNNFYVLNKYQISFTTQKSIVFYQGGHPNASYFPLIIWYYKQRKLLSRCHIYNGNYLICYSCSHQFQLNAAFTIVTTIFLLFCLSWCTSYPFENSCNNTKFHLISWMSDKLFTIYSLFSFNGKVKQCMWLHQK